MSGLPLTTTVADVKKHSMHSGLSSEFSNLTLKKHIDCISKHMAIKEWKKCESNNKVNYYSYSNTIFSVF